MGLGRREKEYKRALELNPSFAAAHANYGVYLSALDRPAEALAEIKRAEDLDPLRIPSRCSEGAILYLARRYEEAIQQLQSVIQMQPDYVAAYEALGDTYDAKGVYPEAITAFQKVISISTRASTSLQCSLGYAYAKSGKRNEAIVILNTLKTTKEYVSRADLAILYVGLDDKKGAFAALEQAYAEHDLQLLGLKVEPHYDALRSDPRFGDLLRRVRLP